MPPPSTSEKSSVPSVSIVGASQRPYPCAKTSHSIVCGDYAPRDGSRLVDPVDEGVGGRRGYGCSRRRRELSASSDDAAAQRAGSGGMVDRAEQGPRVGPACG